MPRTSRARYCPAMEKSAALSYNCTTCHLEENLSDWAKFAQDIPAKQAVRRRNSWR